MSTIASKLILRKNLHQILCRVLSAKHHQWCPQFVTWCDLWLKVLLIGSTASTTPRGSFSPTYKQTQSKSVWSHFIIQMNIQGVSAFYLIYSLTLTNIDKIWNCGFLLKLFFLQQWWAQITEQLLRCQKINTPISSK